MRTKTNDVLHPAKYSPELLPHMGDMLMGANRILDPFGGVGGIYQVAEHMQPLWHGWPEIECLEIQPGYARADPRITLGNALCIPWPANYFNAICTSPAYGNRLADKIKNRSNYQATLDEPLHTDNAGGLQWGSKYRRFHRAAWLEARRVLKKGGIFVLNCKDHYRKFTVQPVTEWHVRCLCSLGFEVLEWRQVDTPGYKYGANSDLRLAYEWLIKLVLKEKTDDDFEFSQN